MTWFARKLPEWRGLTPDAAVPPRVKLRIFESYGGKCCCGCGRKIMTGEAWQLDHVVALINGGEHREINMHPLLTEHHKEKTRSDVRQKSRSYKRRATHAGIKRKRSSFATNRDGAFRKRMDGTIERRNT